ncbi:MAG: hypothetical protein QM758_11865 [Armatimonas sp.]
MAPESDPKKPLRSGWWLPALVLLWSEGLFYGFYYNEELLVAIKDGFGFGMVMWFLLGLGGVLYSFRRKDKWALIALVALVLGITRTCCIDHTTRNAERWQALRPTLEARLPEILKSPLPKEVQDKSGRYYFAPNVRVALDDQGKRQIAFIRYRIGGSNSLVYLYNPSDSNARVPWDGLFGFGQLGQMVSLGGHWYRCLFT